MGDQTESVVVTADGSFTLRGRERETYHSVHGALTESQHVFIAGGRIAERLRNSTSLNVLEVGFGTGLNYLLTADLATRHSATLHYVALENQIIQARTFDALQHARHLNDTAASDNLSIALCQWHAQPAATLESRTGSVELVVQIGDATAAMLSPNHYDVVFHDAFSPSTSPSLWTESFLNALLSSLRPGGALLTYCAKGYIRRQFEALGYTVERLPGAPGKREMLRVLANTQVA